MLGGVDAVPSRVHDIPRIVTVENIYILFRLIKTTISHHHNHLFISSAFHRSNHQQPFTFSFSSQEAHSILHHLTTPTRLLIPSRPKPIHTVIKMLVTKVFSAITLAATVFAAPTPTQTLTPTLLTSSTKSAPFSLPI